MAAECGKVFFHQVQKGAMRSCLTAGPTGCLDVGHSAGGSVVVVVVVGVTELIGSLHIKHGTLYSIFRNIICRFSILAALIFYSFAVQAAKAASALLLLSETNHDSNRDMPTPSCVKLIILCCQMCVCVFILPLDITSIATVMRLWNGQIQT